MLERKQKLDLLLKNGLCFNCLLGGHRAAKCQSTVRCSQDSCGRKHHNSLHIQGTKIGPRNQVPINSAYQMNQKCYLGFIPVHLKGPLGSIEKYAFLDNGSDTTLIDHTTAETLGLLGASRKLTIATLHGTEVQNTALVTIDVEVIDRSHSLKIDDTYVIKELPIKDACTPSEVSMKDWPHLRDVQLHRLSNPKISILIGMNVPESQWVIEQRIGNRKQPFASRTVFGWVIFGPNEYNFRKGTSVNCIATQQSTDEDILRFFESEFVEWKDDPDKAMSWEDRQVFENISGAARLIDNHYVVPIPWKEPLQPNSVNREVVTRRLGYLCNRLRADRNLLEQYTRIIADHETKGYVSRVTEDIAEERFFVPHHPVINSKKPGKVRYSIRLRSPVQKSVFQRPSIFGT